LGLGLEELGLLGIKLSKSSPCGVVVVGLAGFEPAGLYVF